MIYPYSSEAAPQLERTRFSENHVLYLPYSYKNKQVGVSLPMGTSKDGSNHGHAQKTKEHFKPCQGNMLQLCKKDVSDLANLCLEK